MSTTTDTRPNDLESWLAQERDVRTRMDAGVGPGVARPEQVAGKTGLQVMQGLLTGELPHAHMAKTLDFMLIEVGPGLAIFQGTPGVQHLNPLGTVHGGWFASLLDSALGCAVHTMMPPGRGYTTADLSVKLVKALTPQSAARAGRCQSAALRPPTGHRRGATGRAGWYALRPCEHCLPGF